ncbi:MAG: hypothetical protein RL885_20470 [Planctomycetota bacterium]
MESGLGDSAVSRTGPSPKRVVKTGLALVHENEIVYPAAGSEAMAVRVADEGGFDIVVHFPVVIEVTGEGSNLQEATAEEAARAESRRLGELLRRS